MKSRRYVRLAFTALAALIAAWLLPSWIHADRYRRRLQANLQQALGRPVRFSAIYFRLLPRPGFSIDNAAVLEDPAFGSEAFARVDHIDCDLAVKGLLSGSIELARLHLQNAAVNLVRNSSGQWNVEHMARNATPSGPAANAGSDLAIDVEGSRLNFKIVADKKPFAVEALNGLLYFDRRRGELDFDLTGAPVRKDLGLPTPGPIHLQGKWSPGDSQDGALAATLTSRGALVYDWIPLLMGHNPGIYGLMDVEAHLNGSLSVMDVDAQARFTELRRWESLPPSGDLPVGLSLQARLDRESGQLKIATMQTDFGGSHLTLRGKVSNLGHEPVLDLLAAVQGSRLEDFAAFAMRFEGAGGDLAHRFGLSGSLVGLAAITGSWSQPLFSGSLSTSAARLAVGNSSLPISDGLVQFEGRQVSLFPVKITLGPRVSAVADGVLRLSGNGQSQAPVPNRIAHKRSPRPTPESGYRLTLAVHAVPGHDLVGFARTAGLSAARDIDLHGPVTATLAIAAPALANSRPVLSGSADLQDNTLWLPGLVHPLPIREAHIGLEDNRIVVSPLTVSFGGSLVTARLSHTGLWSEPWTFEAQDPALDLGEAVYGFEAFGREASWFERIPGLNTLAGRRAAGAGLLNALNLRGEITTPALMYRGLALRNLSARIEVSKRDLRVTAADFRVSSGKGHASAQADLSGTVPRLALTFDLEGLRVENWASRLPAQLAELRGNAGFSGRVSSEGDSWPQLESNLVGRAQLRVASLDFGHFDPLRSAAQLEAFGEPAPARGPVTIRAAGVTLAIRERHADIEPLTVELGGALFQMTGGCDFAGNAQFETTVDLRHINRRWQTDPEPDATRTGRFLISGDLNALRATAEDTNAQARR